MLTEKCMQQSTTKVSRGQTEWHPTEYWNLKHYFKENIWATFFTFNWWISIWETNIKLGWHAKFDDLENCFFLYLISLIQIE